MQLCELCLCLSIMLQHTVVELDFTDKSASRADACNTGIRLTYAPKSFLCSHLSGTKKSPAVCEENTNSGCCSWGLKATPPTTHWPMGMSNSCSIRQRRKVVFHTLFLLFLLVPTLQCGAWAAECVLTGQVQVPSVASCTSSLEAFDLLQDISLSRRGGQDWLWRHSDVSVCSADVVTYQNALQSSWSPGGGTS